jgi:splicing factor 45
MITMNIRFGNTENMKKGWNVSLRSAAWKLKSASDAAALEVITPKVNRKTLDQERQVLNSQNLLLDAPHSSSEGRFGGHDDRWSREDEEYPQSGIGSSTVIRPAPPDIHMSGEEAYQRRLAMSTGFRPASQTTSSALMAVDDDTADSAAIGSPAPLAKAETGEEAYLRRVAMSQGPPPPPSQHAPSQPPSITGDESYHLRASQQPPILPLQNEREPSETLSDPPGYNPFAPQSAPPPPPPPSIPSAASTGNNPSDFEERVRNSRNTAAAIAARISALVPSAEGKDLSDSVPAESVPESSAQYAS